MKPNFIIIGAARSGTTSLYKYLESHPEIFLADIKEINFFSNPRIWKNGLDWYESHFIHATQKAIGEASTSYTRYPFGPDVAKRIYRYNPHIKLIYVIRDPIERLLSHYLHRVSRGIEDRSLDNIITNCPDDAIFWQGKYFEQYRQYSQYFNIDQILVFSFEEFIKNPDNSIKNLYQFLDVDPSFLPTGVEQVHNKNIKITMKAPFGRYILKLYRRHLEQTNIPYSLKKYILSLAEIGASGIVKSTLDDDQKEMLFELYQDDVRHVQNEIGINISDWKNFTNTLAKS